jgi:MarR family 2-MHQ and catechol resistance regulon transcriptional repressor
MKERSSILFPFTDAIKAYVTIRRSHDQVHRHVSKKLLQRGLSVPQYGVIRQLYDHESLTLSELSELIFCGNSNLTGLIDRMEREGLVERINSKRDRRVKKVCLTEKGIELASKIIGDHRAFLHEMMMNCLSPDEQRTLVDMLTRVKDSIG